MKGIYRKVSIDEICDELSISYQKAMRIVKNSNIKKTGKIRKKTFYNYGEITDAIKHSASPTTACFEYGGNRLNIIKFIQPAILRRSGGQYLF